MFDEIRFVNMIDFGRSISSPKLDVIPFGHWSGTGLVDISNRLTYEKIAKEKEKEKENYMTHWIGMGWQTQIRPSEYCFELHQHFIPF